MPYEVQSRVQDLHFDLKLFDQHLLKIVVFLLESSFSPLSLEDRLVVV